MTEDAVSAFASFCFDTIYLSSVLTLFQSTRLAHPTVMHHIAMIMGRAEVRCLGFLKVEELVLRLD